MYFFFFNFVGFFGFCTRVASRFGSGFLRFWVAKRFHCGFICLILLEFVDFVLHLFSLCWIWFLIV